jgi:hypothetical protein
MIYPKQMAPRRTSPVSALLRAMAFLQVWSLLENFRETNARIPHHPDGADGQPPSKAAVPHVRFSPA